MTTISGLSESIDDPRGAVAAAEIVEDPRGEIAPPETWPPAPGKTIHWVFLTIAIVVVVLSFTMRVPGQERVYLPFINAPVPGTCVSRELSGIECPGCGLTRSFISLGHGEFHRAWQFNPAGFVIFLIVAGQIPYRIVQLWRIRQGRELPRSKATMWIAYVAVLALLSQWAVRRIMEWLSS